jgi:hypothetical protein
MPKCLRSLPTAIVVLLTATALAQQVDPAMHGFWVLNVQKSDFAGRPQPKLGIVNWGEHGWTVAIVTAEGRLYADAVGTDHGCTLIGVCPDFSCEVEVVAPRHLRLTTQTTHRVTPLEGAPYVEKTIWEKQVRK